MAAPTLVLSPRYTSDSRALRAAALEAGWSVERLGGWRVPERLYGREVVLYGEPLFVEVIAARLSLALIDAPFDWLLHLPMRYRLRTIELTTLGEARTFTLPTFVKPADGRKGFEGTVYSSAAPLPPAESVPDATPVFVAEPATWEIEFRCFILEKRVMTLSPYLRNGEIALAGDGTWEASLEEYEQARGYIEALLADQEVCLPPAIVIDIGKIRDRGWGVVEANTAWGAGIYGCDASRVLPVLARSCIRREQLTEDDTAWVLNKVELLDE
jgi:hypothetical protein